MAETRIDQPSAREITPGPHEAKPPPARRRRPPAARVALMHGAYLVGAGLWPILDLRSFMVATGPKLEGWLPKGVGACMALGSHLTYLTPAFAHVSSSCNASAR